MELPRRAQALADSAGGCGRSMAPVKLLANIGNGAQGFQGGPGGFLAHLGTGSLFLERADAPSLSEQTDTYTKASSCALVTVASSQFWMRRG